MTFDFPLVFFVCSLGIGILFKVVFIDGFVTWKMTIFVLCQFKGFRGGVRGRARVVGAVID